MIDGSNSQIAVKSHIENSAWINTTSYSSMYQQSITNTEQFWSSQAVIIDWIEDFSCCKEVSFSENLIINWFKGGKLNICYNAVDRHLKKFGDKTAIIWQGDDPEDHQLITYNNLHEQVCRLANGLKSLGVKKGDRICIYLPMIPEAAYAMLACARIGAIHSVVFAGFSPETLKDRINDCGAKIIITSDESVRGGKKIPLKNNVDLALLGNDSSKVIVVEKTGADVNWYSRDIKYSAITDDNSDCPVEIIDASDPLFILYTSGSTGKPKGVQHNTGGYAVYVATTFKYIFDYHDNDIYWCTADIGWITGHSYLIYGPLLNGATTLMFEGVPNYPDFSRLWQIIDQYKVNIFYTAPTVIRSLMREDESFITRQSLDTLRILGTVGEPINPDVWLWYYDKIGRKNCPIVDTWWQTETGGIVITPLPGSTTLKPGSASLPFFGIVPVIVDEHGHEKPGEADGYLCIKDSWPGQMSTVYGDHKRFYDTYFSRFKNLYFTGDGAKRDKDGYYWITGRVDDVLNVSGHRLGTAEIESAIVSHPSIAEAAVVGYPHPIKGQGIYAFVTAKSFAIPSDDLKKEIIAIVRAKIGPIATPDLIQWAPALPKTRSGKIMRRILRRIAENNYSDLGDVNTLTNYEVIDQLIADRLNK